MKHMILIVFVLFFIMNSFSSELQSKEHHDKAQAIEDDEQLLYGEGGLNGAFAILQFPRDTVEEMLPDGLVLGKSPLENKGMHIVMFLFGEQIGVHAVLAGHRLPGIYGESYPEFVLAIPFVLRATDSEKNLGPYTYLPVLYLDNIRAIVSGRVYGFNKEYAKVISSHYDFTVKSICSDETLIGTIFKDEKSSEPFSLNQSVENLLEEIFLLPIISKHFCSFFSCATYNWNFDTASLAPLHMNLQVGSDFLNGIISGNYIIDPISLTIAPGAFKMNTKWSLSLPYGCK